MERRTVRDVHEGCCRIHINNGRGVPWCRFDYVIRPAPSIEGVMVELGPKPDDETIRWFPDVSRGVALGKQFLYDHCGVDLIGLHMTITKVYSHPVATTSQGCERYGQLFITGFGNDKSKCFLVDREVLD